MTEIDVTNKVFFSSSVDGETEKCYIQCVCGGDFDYSISIDLYNSTSKLMWDCPRCGAKLYFKRSGERQNRIVQVIDD